MNDKVIRYLVGMWKIQAEASSDRWETEVLFYDPKHNMVIPQNGCPMEKSHIDWFIVIKYIRNSKVFDKQIFSKDVKWNRRAIWLVNWLWAYYFEQKIRKG